MNVPGDLVEVSIRARLLRRGALLDQRDYGPFLAGHWLDQREPTQPLIEKPTRGTPSPLIE